MIKKNTLMFLSTGLLIILLSCGFPISQKQEIISRRDEYYNFSPETILTDILEERKNIFKPLIETQQTPSPENLSTVQWTEKDYYFISHAMYKQIFNENPSGWNLRHASFHLDCSEILDGPQLGVLVFNKITNIRDQASLIERRVYIDVSKNNIHVIETEYYPNLLSNYSTIKTETNLTFKEVLEIAEKHGGAGIRKNSSDNCQVSVEIFGGNDNWRVTYVDVLTLFEISINVNSGNFKVIKK
jgi:hypothetical protein